MSGLSPAQALAALPEEDRASWVKAKGEEAISLLRSDWRFWARPNQRPPAGSWRWWVVKTGRGYGKTRTGAEWVCDRCEAFAHAGAPHLVGLGNRTFGEVTAVQIEGESGLKAVAARRGHVFKHAPTSREAELVVRTPAGRHVSRVELHTSAEPERSRGRNFHTFWHDEFASYFAIVDDQGGTMFTNVDLGLRALGPLPPQGIATTTPRFVPWLTDLIAGKFGEVALTEGALYENLANLAPSFVKTILDRYADSPLGPQEIFGILMAEVEGSLWKRAWLERTRITADRLPEDLVAVALGVDPPGEAWGAECGIVGVALGPAPLGWKMKPGSEGLPHLYVVADGSMSGDADTWPMEAGSVYRNMPVVGGVRHLVADRLAAEVNNGADMVRAVIQVHDPSINVHKVRATRGKYVRAEPVAMLWGPQQDRAHIVGHFPELEAQLTGWKPGDDSPDRLDALVWGATELLPDLSFAGEVGAYSAADVQMR